VEYEMTNKATDNLTFKEWSDKIVAFLESQGYTIDKIQKYRPWSGSKKDEIGFVNASKEMVDSKTRMKHEIRVTREWDKIQKVSVRYPEPNVHSKTVVSHTSFTMEELQFFDSMGLELDGYNADYQKIDDWFWKAGKKTGDSKTNLQTKIAEFLYAKDYIPVLDNFSDKGMFKNSLKYTNENTHVSFYVLLEEGLVSKHREVGGRGSLLTFTVDELRFFDGIGFDLGKMDKTVNKQNIEDWWDEKSSVLAELDIALESKGYFRKHEIDISDPAKKTVMRYRLTGKNPKTGLNSDTIIFLRTSSTGQKHMIKYRLDENKSGTYDKISEKFTQFEREVLRKAGYAERIRL